MDWPRVVGDEVRDVRPQLVARRVGRRRAEPQENLRQVRRAGIHHGHQHVLDGFRQLFVQPAHHAAVQHPHHPARQQHQVPRMRVGVVKGVAEDHLQVHVGAAPRELVQVRARRRQRRSALLPRMPSSRSIVSTPPGGQGRVGAREMHGGVIGEVAGELLQVAALEGEVQLAQQRAPELPHDRARLVGTHLRRMLLGQLGQPGQDIQVGHDLVRDARVLHFDHHVLARWQPRAMHLGNRGRGQRRVVEFGKQRSSPACRTRLQSSPARPRAGPPGRWTGGGPVPARCPDRPGRAAC